MNRLTRHTRTALIRSRRNMYCAIAMLTLASLVHAADTDRVTPKLIDLNGDHQISYDEFVHSAVAKAMHEMDQDKNGFLTPAEIAARGANKAASVVIDFSKADSNGDGRLSNDELTQALHAHPRVHTLFEKLDQNNDGVLTEPELKNLHGVPLIWIEF